jgi:NTE family protein
MPSPADRQGRPRLNELGFLPRIARVSGVSGGAIVAAVIGTNWKRLDFGPDGIARNFQACLVEPLRQQALQTIDLTWSAFIGAYLPFLQGWRNRRFAEGFDLLFDHTTLRDLPNEPVSATNMQTSSLFRVSKAYLSDPLLGKVYRPDLRLSHVVAASAASPPIQTPLILKFTREAWEPALPVQSTEFFEEVYLS